MMMIVCDEAGLPALLDYINDISGMAALSATDGYMTQPFSADLFQPVGDGLLGAEWEPIYDNLGDAGREKADSAAEIVQFMDGVALRVTGF